MTLVLDTSAASAVMHGLPQAEARLRREQPADIVLCAPVAAEIGFGLERLARGSRRRRLLEAAYASLRSTVSWADWTEEAAVEFGRQKARLTRLGAVIEDFDIAIGSVALAVGGRLATLNAKHMRRLDGLVVEDWSKA